VATPVDRLRTLVLVGKVRGFNGECPQMFSAGDSCKELAEPEQAMLDFRLFEQMADS